MVRKDLFLDDESARMKTLPKQAVSKQASEFEVSISENSDEHYAPGKHPNSQANLIPFQKGVSGNPGGRPHKYARLKQALDEVGNDLTEIWQDLNLVTVTNREAVINTIWKKAKEGHMQSISILAELGCLDPKS